MVEEGLKEEVASCGKLLKEWKAFILRDLTFSDFKKVLEGYFSSGANSIFYAVGKGCGMRSCRRLMTFYHERGDLFDALIEYKQEEGWGIIRVAIDNETGAGRVYVSQSFEARGYGKSEEPVCYFLKGYLEGFLSTFFGKEFVASETHCIAKGDKECIFEIETKG